MSAVPASSSRAFAATGLLLLMLGMLAGGLLYAVVEYENGVLQVAAQEAELEILKRRPLTRTAAAAAVVAGDPFLEGATAPLAANLLQQRIVGLVEDVGGKLLSVAIESPSDAPEARSRIVVQATADMDVDALQTLLFRIESTTPFLFVDSLTVQRKEGEEDSEKATATEPQGLHVDLRVAGFRREADPS